MTTELMGDRALVLVVSIVVCMSRELIDSWRDYGEQ